MSEPCFKCKNSECLTTFNQRIICPHCQRPAQVIYPRASPKETPEAAIVLVLDGGGMRGLSSLFILKALMEEVQKVINSNDEPLPGNYFTFIMGTSTGGIIATMQGIFGLSVSDCIKEYQDIGQHIFARPRHFHLRTPVWFPRAKYDSDDFENCVSTFVHNKSNNLENSPLKRSSLYYFNKFVKLRLKKAISKMFRGEAFVQAEKEVEPECRFSRPGALSKTAVFASKEDGKFGEDIFVFRSYDHEKSNQHGNRIVRNPGRACEASIVDVVRATSAAPSYFRQVEIESPKLCLQDSTTSKASEVFIDGGTAANNPSPLAWNEACAWQMGVSGRQYSSVADAVGCFVSIGCGRTEWRLVPDASTPPISKYFRMMLSLSKIITETKPAHRETRGKARHNNVPYFRFNVMEGLENMKMDEWSSMKRKIDGEAYRAGQKVSTYHYIEEVTRRYIEGETGKTDDVDDYPDKDCKTSVRDDLRTLAKMLVDYKSARDDPTRERSMGETLGPTNAPCLGNGSRSPTTQTADNDDTIEPAL